MKKSSARQGQSFAVSRSGAALSLVAIRLSLSQSVAATVQSLASLRPSAHGTKTVAPHHYGSITVPVSSA